MKVLCNYDSDTFTILQHLWWNNARLNDISTILTIRRTCTIKKKENNKIEKKIIKITSELKLNLNIKKKKERKERLNCAQNLLFHLRTTCPTTCTTHLDNPRRDLPFSPKPHPSNMWRLLIFFLPLWNALPFYPAALFFFFFLHRVRDRTPQS